MAEMEYVLVATVVLVVIGVLVTTHYLGRHKEEKRKKEWSNSEPSTKYRELRFDYERGEYIIEADVFFTQKNNCPVLFKGKGQKMMCANFHFRYTLFERDYKDTKYIKEIESHARRILTEEILNLTDNLESSSIDGHLIKHLKSIRPIFAERMNKYVVEVNHLMIIGKLELINDDLCSKSNTIADSAIV